MHNPRLFVLAAFGFVLGAAPAAAAPKKGKSRAPTSQAVTTPRIEISPAQAKSLSQPKPPTGVKKAAAAKDLGVIVRDMKKPVKLTVRRPFANKRTYLEFMGAGRSLPQLGKNGTLLVGLAGKDDYAPKTGPSRGTRLINNYLAVNFRAKAGLDYIVTCAASSAQKKFKAIVEVDGAFSSGHAIEPDAGWLTVAIPASGSIRDIRISIATKGGLLPDFNALGSVWWSASRCDITPASG